MNLTACYDRFAGPIGILSCNFASTLDSALNQAAASMPAFSLPDDIVDTTTVVAASALAGMIVSKSKYICIPSLIMCGIGFTSPEPKIQLISGTIFSAVIYSSMLNNFEWCKISGKDKNLFGTNFPSGKVETNHIRGCA